MLLAYLDESYTDTHYFIGALVVGEAAARPLTADLDAVLARAAANYPGIDVSLELHAHELVGAKGGWKPMARMLRARIGIYEQVLTAIARHDARFIVQGIDRAKHSRLYSAPQNPHSLALTWTMERVNEYARQIERGTATPTFALLLADEVDQRDEHRRNLWTAQRTGTWGYRAQVLDRIVDTIYFTPSHSSRLLQAADLATFVHRRRTTHEETDPRAEASWARLYALLQPQIVRQRIWPR
ncbi:DUF3800 domain-containing protein [Pseudonocardia sp. HH130630-07]|uniref:DUF3800 domain-containing protein n=1 Tax=Pseudonocardia sp. HH130630-07 TaxID=1690815 RepID=UPI000814BA7F|nr:DUF3800 domain-containing protein [Pseudonocardia sp. HH130630-07]ANY06187.1 hypothetical protein AFB00_07630 [Pseudonocardia sp. HH130630-07]